MSDPQGNVLVHTGLDANGCVIKRADGSVLPAVSPFYSDPSVFLQSWLFLPWPGDNTKLAAIRRQPDLTASAYQSSRFLVGCIDLTAGGGLGAITAPPAILQDSMAPKLTAVPHANGQDYWILGHKHSSDTFHAYHLRPNGVDTIPVVSHAGAVLPGSAGGFTDNPMIHGPLVANYVGDKLVCVSYSNLPAIADTSIVELFYFDNATGVVSLMSALSSDRTFFGCGGAEFSPDGSKLYVAEVPDGFTLQTRLVQYDLSNPEAGAILNTETILNESMGSLDLSNSVVVAAAPDGRIYIGKGWGAVYLGMIEHPDSAGTACGLVPQGLFLPNNSAGELSLPNFCKRYHDSEMSVSVSEVSSPETSLPLWPVPAGALLNVSVPASGRLAVLDILGREVAWQRAGVQGNVDLEVGGLAAGTYLLRFVPTHGTILTGTFLKE